MPSLFTRFVFALILSTALIHCSGSTTSSTKIDDEPDTSDTVDTEKLKNTPFEGLTRGDDFDWEFFRCGNYRTETVDELPIKIFAAFFTEGEEEEIQAGIDVANTAMGPTEEGGVFYELTDEWSYDVRAIYKVGKIADEGTGLDLSADAITLGVSYGFNGRTYAETVVSDWAIELRNWNRWVVAHELGHATGLFHQMIDYEHNTLFYDEPNGGLEENSLMELDAGGDEPQLNDYNDLMAIQAQILDEHLADNPGTMVPGFCEQIFHITKPVKKLFPKFNFQVP